MIGGAGDFESASLEMSKEWERCCGSGRGEMNDCRKQE